jgi:hypothetical protein
MLTLGIVFLLCGATFLIVGLTTHLLALSVVAPAFIALGITFTAISKVRAKRAENVADS